MDVCPQSYHLLPTMHCNRINNSAEVKGHLKSSHATSFNELFFLLAFNHSQETGRGGRENWRMCTKGSRGRSRTRERCRKTEPRRWAACINR